MTQARTEQVGLLAVAQDRSLKVQTEQVPLQVKRSVPTNFFDALVGVVGFDNIIEGWRLEESSGPAIGVKDVADMTAGADVIARGQGTGVPARPKAAEVSGASPGDAFDAGNPSELDFDARNENFSIVFWAKMDGSTAAGLFGKQSVLGGAGYQACLRPDVNPDQMQWRVRDGTVVRTAIIVDNSVSDDQWHLWTFINDATNSEIRLHLDNGTPSTVTHSTLGDTSNTGNLLIGDDLTFVSMSGELNHVYFVSLALSQAQVNQLFAAG